MRQLQIELSSTIFAAWEPEYNSARKELLASLVTCKKAWDQARRVGHQIVSAGGASDIRNLPFMNVSAAADSPRALGAMSLPSFIACNRNLIG